jgi:hypothetical protein
VCLQQLAARTNLAMPGLATRTDVGAALSSHQDQIIDDMADPTPVIASSRLVPSDAREVVPIEQRTRTYVVHQQHGSCVTHVRVVMADRSQISLTIDLRELQRFPLTRGGGGHCNSSPSEVSW